MGLRGPQPGWKQAKKLASMPAADRENPEKLSGDLLRQLAHRRGIARSESARMSDEKLRVQLKYVTYRQYEADDALV